MQEKTNTMFCSGLYLSGFAYASPEIIDAIKRMLFKKRQQKREMGDEKIVEQLKFPKLKRALLSFLTYLPLASGVS